MTSALYKRLLQMEENNNMLVESLSDCCSILEYKEFVCNNIWTSAINKALTDHQIVIIPELDEPYLIDDSIIIPSNRKIIAYGATIKMVNGMDVLMLRNEHPVDETHNKIDILQHDENISIYGGTFEECYTNRLGYGKSGKYDKERSFYGVSCCMLFDNVEHLNLYDITFVHCAGFAVQLGEAYKVVIKNIYFDNCFADGLHFCGNIKDVFVTNVKGNVGDDLVALNMYDWQNSSITFGPGENIWIEDLCLEDGGKYKAIRLEPGTYTFDNGEKINCSLNNVMIKNVKGIRTFKMYMQTPPYLIGEMPERGEVGSAKNIYFENIDIDLNAPIDKFHDYLNGDKVRGTFAAFELGANIDGLKLENIRVKLYKETYPEGYILSIGPKSIVHNGKEIFDPYISSEAGNVVLKNIYVNDEKIKSLDGYIKEICFDDINCDGHSTGKGIFKHISIE